MALFFQPPALGCPDKLPCRAKYIDMYLRIKPFVKDRTFAFFIQDRGFRFRVQGKRRKRYPCLLLPQAVEKVVQYDGPDGTWISLISVFWLFGSNTLTYIQDAAVSLINPLL